MNEQDGTERYFQRMSSSAFAKAAREFADMLDSRPHERVVQAFLQSHAYFLTFGPYQWHEYSVSQPRLGSQLQPDFGLFGTGNISDWWTFVELEQPDDRLFSKSGNPSTKLVHALRQTRDWRSWLAENHNYFEKTFRSYYGWIKTAVVLGRRNSLSDSDRKQLKQMNAEENRTNQIIVAATNTQFAVMRKPNGLRFSKCQSQIPREFADEGSRPVFRRCKHGELRPSDYAEARNKKGRRSLNILKNRSQRSALSRAT